MNRLRNDLYCVEWDVKLYYTIPYHRVMNAVRKDMNTSRQMVPVAVTASYSVDEDNEDKVYCHHHTLVCYVHK